VASSLSAIDRLSKFIDPTVNHSPSTTNVLACSVGCIRTQRCHTNHCPTGVATHHLWLVRGVDPTSKAAPVGQLHITLRKDVLALSVRVASHIRHSSPLINSSYSTIGSVQPLWWNCLDTVAALGYHPRRTARRCVA